MANGASRVLDGFRVSTPGLSALPARVCAEHLCLLGAQTRGGGHTGRGTAGELWLRPGAGTQQSRAGSAVVDCSIHWQPPAPGKPTPSGSELLVQAVSGLMALHGRDRGVPRRLGLEVASVTAGILATQGILAALIASSRGFAVRQVETSVFQAALLLLSHHLAITTTPDGISLAPVSTGPGPPFRTADGELVEIEALVYGTWIAFWSQLGVQRRDVDAAWSPFVHRYLAATCSLPPSLHEAAARCSLAEIRRAADACGLAVCRVRSYPELLAQPGAPPGDGNAPWTIQPRPGRPEPARAPRLAGTAPLDGIRVVEATSRLQGPLAGLLLRMLGAEVVKVEPPGGDFGRHAPPLAGSHGAAYLAYNRGKWVEEIDYKHPDGRARLADLAADADVFLHNWRSGRAETLGLTPEKLSARNPGLVYAHASGWGPAADEPCAIAGDFLVQAHGACGDGLNPAGELPVPSRLTILDVTGGLLACEGILAGLYLRERSGYGSRVDTSLFSGAMALQRHVLRAMAAGKEGDRLHGRPVWGPLDQPVETAAGYLVLEVADGATRRRLLKAGGLRDDADDAALLDRLRARSASEWEQILGEVGVPSAAVCGDLASLPADRRTAGLLERVEGDCWMAGAPWRLSP